MSPGCACRLRLAVTLLVKNLSHMHVSSSTSKGGTTSIGVAPPQTLTLRGAETVAAQKGDKSTGVPLTGTVHVLYRWTPAPFMFSG